MGAGLTLGLCAEPLRLWLGEKRKVRRLRWDFYREMAWCYERLMLLSPDQKKRAVDPRAFDLEQLLRLDAGQIEPYLSERGLSERYFLQLKTPVYDYHRNKADPGLFVKIPEAPVLDQICRMFEGLREPHVTDETPAEDRAELLRMKFFNAVKTLEYIERFMNEGAIEGRLLLKLYQAELREKQERTRNYTRFIRKRRR
jgi:hypothetical protein